MTLRHLSETPISSLESLPGHLERADEPSVENNEGDQRTCSAEDQKTERLVDDEVDAIVSQRRAYWHHLHLSTTYHVTANCCDVTSPLIDYTRLSHS